MGSRRRWRPSWRGFLAVTAIACLTLALADYDAPDGDSQYIRQQPDTSYCNRAANVLRVLLDVLQERRSYREIAPDLATLDAGFQADGERFRQRGRHLIALKTETMRSVVHNMQRELRPRIERGGDLTAYAQGLNNAVNAATDDYCREPSSYEWRGDDRLEAVVPSTWLAKPVPWVAADGTTVGPGVVLSGEPGVWHGRYLSPATRVGFAGSSPLYPRAGIFLGASPELARRLRLNGTRTAVALDRLRAWMDEVRYDHDCQLVHVSPYKRPSSSYWGFVREWRNCQDAGTALVEAYVLNTAPGLDRPMVVLFQATATDPAELYAVPKMLETFHVIWERVS